GEAFRCSAWTWRESSRNWQSLRSAWRRARETWPINRISLRSGAGRVSPADHRRTCWHCCREHSRCLSKRETVCATGSSVLRGVEARPDPDARTRDTVPKLVILDVCERCTNLATTGPVKSFTHRRPQSGIYIRCPHWALG